MNARTILIGAAALLETRKLAKGSYATLADGKECKDSVAPTYAVAYCAVGAISAVSGAAITDIEDGARNGYTPGDHPAKLAGYTLRKLTGDTALINWNDAAHDKRTVVRKLRRAARALPKD